VVHLYDDQAAQLLRVFEQYCMHSQRDNYRFLRLSGWLNLLRDSQLLGKGGLTQTGSEVLFVKCTSDGHKSMVFEELCHALQQVASWRYDSMELDEALEALLANDIFPATKVEEETDLQTAIAGHEEEVQNVVERFEGALWLIYQSYVTRDTLPAGVHWDEGGAYEQAGWSLGHRDFLQFAHEYDLQPLLNEATLSRVFRASIGTNPEHPAHSLPFSSFVKCLCRCAVQVYDDIPPSAAFERLMYQLAASEACSNLERKHHGQPSGQALHNMILACTVEQPPESPPETSQARHQLGGEAQELLEPDQYERMRSIFDFYISSGTLQAHLRMGCSKFLNLMHDCKVIEEGLTMVDVDIAFGTEARRRGEVDPSNARGSGPAKAVDFDGFIRALLHLACRKFPGSNSEIDALDSLLAIHIFPYARYFEEVASSDKPGDDPEVAQVFSRFAKDLQVFFNMYAKCNQVSRSAYLKFAREFDIMPRLSNQRELSETYKSVCGEEEADFEHFTDCVISQAVVGFGKPAKAELYPTLGDKAKAMVVHLTVSAGRQKSGLPVNKYAIVNYTKQEEEKKMEKLYV